MQLLEVSLSYIMSKVNANTNSFELQIANDLMELKRRANGCSTQ